MSTRLDHPKAKAKRKAAVERASYVPGKPPLAIKLQRPGPQPKWKRQLAAARAKG